MGGQISPADRKLVILTLAITREINKRRSIVTVLNSVKFHRIWNHSTEKDKEDLIQDLEIRNAEHVKQWMEDNPAIELEEKSIKQLKEIARDLDIRNWCRLSVPELVREILNERKRQK